ncbi:MAG: HI0074 family nucleotidyltransferase substrate-binding subunit [Candidatus Omnitrophica bacterium]|nr:HI0074 family nucleotidyltransferase substrate-binding subunit [Candidatus Omnitrophota bacterium]
MNDELKYAITKLEKALNKLKEGVAEAKDELDKDGVIQRFEFTFELYWKALKIFLRNSGVEAKTPKETLKEAFKIGWIIDEEKHLNMLEDRSNTLRIYDKETSEATFKRIKEDYVVIIDAGLKKLSEKDD